MDVEELRGAASAWLAANARHALRDSGAMRRGAAAGARSLLAGADAAGMPAAPGGRTSQIQRTIIGERLLGLPGEPPLAR